jgi:hypothetical protein
MHDLYRIPVRMEEVAVFVTTEAPTAETLNGGKS